MLKKLISMVSVLLLVVGVANTSIKAYSLSDWQTGSNNTYGFAENNGDGIVQLKGAKDKDIYGRNVGPFTKANMPLFSESNNVVAVQTHVKIDLEAMKDSEQFMVDVALNSQNNTEVTGLQMKFLKKGNKVIVSPEPILSNNFTYEISKSGIYTLRWEYKKDTQKVSCDFILKQKDEVLFNGVVADVNEIKGPLDGLLAVGARYLWFHDISVSDGIYVYETLPSDVYQPPVIDKDVTLDNDKIKDAILSSDTQAKIEIKANDSVNEITLPKEAIAAAKENGKELAVEVKDTSGKVQYTWFFSDAIDKDINLVLNQKDTKDIEVLKDIEGVVLDFNHTGALPSGTKVKVDVAKTFVSGDKVKVSYFNEVTNTLEAGKEYVVDKDGNIVVDIEHCSKYVVEKVETETPPTPEDPSDKPSDNPSDKPGDNPSDKPVTKPDVKPTTPNEIPVVKPNTKVEVKPTSPNTGDQTNVAFVYIILGISAISVFALGRKLNLVKGKK